MIGAGTCATIPWDAPTGGWDLNNDQVVYAYYSMGPSKIETPDPRKDPKMWKVWFKEFLALVFPPRRKPVIRTMEPDWLLRRFHRCRSGTIPIREWKMKNWIQALA